jgi:xylulokinase
VESGGYFLGIDLGTSSVKVVLVDSSGWLVASGKEAYPFIDAGPGFFEQDTEDWKRAICAAVRALFSDSASPEPRRVDAVGLSAQLPTLALTDGDGKSTHHAIVWQDARADAIGREMLEKLGARRHYSKTGVVLDGRYLAPMYGWIERNKPECVGPDTRILSAKDYLYRWLTGIFATDPSTASGFGVYSLAGSFDDDFCRELGISPARLPQICGSEKSPGRLLDSARELGLSQGTPVAVGAADSVTGVLGAGAAEKGTVCLIFGSSTAIIGLWDEPILSDERKFFISPLAVPGTFGLEADILSTGSSTAWFERIISEAAAYRPSGSTSNADGAVVRLAGTSRPGARGLLFTPYFSGGEQGVLWDTALSGCLFGLSLDHSLADIARAHFEGICFETRRCLEAFEESEFVVKKIIASGPAAADGFFAQLLTDILGRDVLVSEVCDTSALGAAMIAGVSAGAWTFGEAAKIFRGRHKNYAPDEELRELYSARYSEYIATSRSAKIAGRFQTAN